MHHLLLSEKQSENKALTNQSTLSGGDSGVGQAAAYDKLSTHFYMDDS
ncbi:MAG: hypothetical protein U0264_14335 [Candidatus Kapaibacterium sp.]